MIDLRGPLLIEYERWLRLAGDDHYCGECVIGIHDVLRAHFLLVDYFFSEGEGLGGIGPKKSRHVALRCEQTGCRLRGA